jgi:hypothetical protein
MSFNKVVIFHILTVIITVSIEKIFTFYKAAKILSKLYINQKFL